jgi:Imm-5 like putative immunity protein
MPLAVGELRSLGRWAADCAERVLPLFEARVPADRRPREAIEVIRVFGAGGNRTKQLRVVSLAALAAGREVQDPVAAAAARSAGYAAASAYLHPLATPDQVKHVLWPALHQAHARELADPGTGEAEIDWAVEHVPREVSELLERMPMAKPVRGRLGELLGQLEAGLRS